MIKTPFTKVALTVKSAIILMLLFQVLIGCKQEQRANKPIQEVANIGDKVQIVLKTQSEPYSGELHEKVVSEYTDVSKISVPKSLTPSSKWIMFEGPVLENDKVAYRYYADARHRFDIYGKKVSDLVMDTVSWDYHKIMDWGSDILKVGSSLGIGSPAIVFQDSLYCFEDWDRKEIEILPPIDDNTTTLRTTFIGLTIGDVKMTVQQDWTLSIGNYHSTIHLKRIDGELPETMAFATGIVKHLDNYTTGKKDGQYFGYTWGVQSFHNQNLGMAILSSNDYEPRYSNDKLNHVTIFDKSSTGVKYQFLSVWADGVGDINTEEQFRKELDSAIAQLESK